MSSAFSIAQSALEAESEAINTTGNNLANLNTNGFKESEVDFKNLFSETINSSVQYGLGVTPPEANQVFSQGAIQSSQSPLAAAIQGNGFFVLQSPSGQPQYTRDGNFTTNAKGVLETQTGELVQGWTATASGLNTSGPTSSIVLPAGLAVAPVPTQNFSLNANLDATADGTTPGTFSTPIQIVDSLGTTHNLTVSFTQSATNASTWNYNITIPSGDLTGGTAGQQTQLLATPGSITFNQDGTMSTAGGTAPIQVNINGLKDGAANMSINWNQFAADGTGDITQYAEKSNLASSSQDGTPPAQLTSVAIQNGGQVVATYSNGLTKVEAQLAMASIENPGSLLNLGNNNFAVSGLSAIPAVGIPQTSGRGQILGSSLESSNVDIGTEFTHLIIYQSAYQAGSRIISTVNNMNQDLFSLIH